MIQTGLHLECLTHKLHQMFIPEGACAALLSSEGCSFSFAAPHPIRPMRGCCFLPPDTPQRAQYPLIKEHTLNHKNLNIII